MTGSSDFKDHFSGRPADYAAYRPTYPTALVDFLAGISPARDRALDCGCGTGQLSVLLAERFKEVIATDASAAQVAMAQPHSGVIYRTALAEESGLPDASVDLVTVAQAAHWLDLARFYGEVRRVSRPRAGIALITYGVLHVDDAGIDPIVQDFYYNLVGPYWPPERRHVEERYRNLPFPFHEIQAPELNIEKHWCLADLLGYFDTWSGVKAAEKALGHDAINSAYASLSKAWGEETTQRKVSWPLSLRVGNV